MELLNEGVLYAQRDEIRMFLLRVGIFCKYGNMGDGGFINYTKSYE